VPSGRGRLAMRFGGLAWLVYRGHCTQGCAHTEGASSGCKRAVGSVICEEGALLCRTCSVRERIVEALQSAASHKSGSGRALLWTRATEHATCTSVGTSPGILVQGFWPLKSLIFEAKRTSFWSARH
jgi:hypothetical protein